jgi:hypothetical protein
MCVTRDRPDRRAPTNSIGYFRKIARRAGASDWLISFLQGQGARFEARYFIPNGSVAPSFSSATSLLHTRRSFLHQNPICARLYRTQIPSGQLQAEAAVITILLSFIWLIPSVVFVSIS